MPSAMFARLNQISDTREGRDEDDATVQDAVNAGCTSASLGANNCLAEQTMR